MVQFDYDGVMKRYNVKVPIKIADESDRITVASISEDVEPKITLHRELSIKLLRQIILSWDEHLHMETMRVERETEELNELLEDEPKNDKLTYLSERRQGSWKDIPIATEREDKYLNFSVRAYNILRTVGIDTVGELVKTSKRELRRYKNCGNKSINEIQEVLSEVGLQLKQ